MVAYEPSAFNLRRKKLARFSDLCFQLRLTGDRRKKIDHQCVNKGSHLLPWMPVTLTFRKGRGPIALTILMRRDGSGRLLCPFRQSLRCSLKRGERLWNERRCVGDNELAIN